MRKHIITLCYIIYILYFTYSPLILVQKVYERSKLLILNNKYVICHILGR